jgi:cytochrome c oxidase subunit IV
MSTQTVSHSAEAHAGEHEHGGPLTYGLTLVALLILTGLTIGASYIDLGSGNVVVALAIATVKATLVALFFMHLLWDKPVNRIIAVAGFLFLGIFLMFDLIDMDTRNYYLPQNVHRTVVPLVPGTAPAPLTEILPQPDEGPTGATPVPGAEAPAASTATPAPAAAAPATDKK